MRGRAPGKYAYQHEKGLSQLARDTRALTDEVEHFDEPTVDTKRAAQRVIAANAVDAEECATFLAMCGLSSRYASPGDGGILTNTPRIV